jgi:hypothetical protein
MVASLIGDITLQFLITCVKSRFAMVDSYHDSEINIEARGLCEHCDQY